MSTNDTSGLCLEVAESLAEILDGTAPARLFDHLADCDACRDLKHEAAHAAEHVAASGADFRPAADFVDALVGRLAAARPDDPPAGAMSSRRQAPRAPEAGSAKPQATVAEAPLPDATVMDPLAAARAEEHRTAPSAISAGSAASEAPDTAKTTFDPLAAAKAEADAAEAPAAGKTIASTRSSEVEAPRASGVSAVTPHRLATGPKPVSATVSDDAAPRVANDTASEEAPVAARASDAREADRKDKPLVVKAPAPKGAKVSFFRRPMVIGGFAALAAAAAAVVGFSWKGHAPHIDGPIAPAPWSGQVASIARASADKTGGLDACDASGACAPLDKGAAVKAGTTLRTDARTRAYVTLGDGTELSIDRGSAVKLSGDKDRTAWIKQGTVVADVTHVDGSTARFGFPHGEVEVLGTKLGITASEDRASVEVARGVVRLSGENGKSVEVRAGEEATMLRGQDPVVASSSSIADTMEWSDKKPEDIDAPVLKGLGELRARKPGQTNEKDHAVRLAKHAVKVRVVDIVARTEVDETFTNDTDEELEGIFRFPLPPGAQIERLALEVDGKLMEGAFVDRDKGAAIWRGVIQNAAPKAPKPRDEIIWVPGPWRDPALLEWQRGGRFELKIFPIPRKGSRRVILTYTQAVEQAAGIRRFTYPLAHDPSGTTKIDSFDLDLQVLGLDKSVGLQTRGYELAAAGEGDRRTMHADGFVPAGDLTVEYALPNRDKEVTAWAYSMSAPVERPSSEPLKAKTLSPADKAAADATAAILDDSSPYVAIALRPKLPRWREAKEHVFAIVVDTSRSMFGERFARASRLASTLVREMDRRDSFVLLACDTVCRPMTEERGASARPEAPGAAAAEKVERFLGQIEPDGGSDLSAAVGAARAAVGSLGGKELRVLYLGDGTPSVGPTRAAHLETAVRAAMPPGDGALVTVALGADADQPSLAAMARGGGGVVIPYVPGQKVSTAALEVLGAAYGVVLRDPEIELPAGLSQVTPARLDPIRAGGETLLVARMNGGNQVQGTVKLRGRVGGERFEQTYPLDVVTTGNSGNAFVPRLYAAAKIAELEQAGGDAQKAAAVELSKRFAVASRFTSLLVLESEAMFKAFGLDRKSVAPSFTGEISAQSSSADADGEADAPADEERAKADKDGRASSLEKKKRALDDGDAFGSAEEAAGGDLGRLGASKGGGGFGGPMGAPATPPAEPSPFPAATSAPASKPVPADPFAADQFQAPRSPAKVAGPGRGWRPPPPPPPPRRLVPMRRVFDRKVAFDAVNGFVTQNSARLAAAESALTSAPDSRDKTVELYSLFATSGRLNEAQELTARWSGRDALDPDALTARADLAARQGDRERAIRILGGLADVRPNDRAIQARLVDLHEAAGNTALACEHRLALADMASGDARIVADAVRCARTQGLGDLATQLRLDAGDKVRDAIDRLLVAPAPAPAGLRGDVQISAEWSGGADLDLAIIDAQGKRSSWLGSGGKVLTSVRDATSTHTETLGLLGLPGGSFVVEIARAGGGADASAVPIRGEVTLRLGGDVRKIPFTLSGPRAEIGTVRVSFTSRLVPVEGFGGGWRGLE
ncbi:MAG: VIT domain-containing protein [Byssovorax sp.]